MTSTDPIEKLLLEQGVATDHEIERARGQLREGVGLPGALAQAGVCDPVELARLIGERTGLGHVETVNSDAIEGELVGPVPIQFAKRNRLIPLMRDEEGIVVALSDQSGLALLHDLRVLFGEPVRGVFAPEGEIVRAINRVYERGSEDAEELMENIAEVGLDSLAQQLEEPRDLLDADDEAPVIRLVNTILFQAVKDRASDIHIEPFEREIHVRYRIDGALYRVLTPPKTLHAPVTSRIKVMAGLDIAEKRLPQDGRIRIKLAGKDIDIRVSVLPTSFGERVVMRLLDKSAVLLDLEELGFDDANLSLFKEMIAKPHGIILVTGPTGSGKTTTLYGALSRMNSEDVNIITVEDPVEYQLRGIGQIHVNPKINLTFAAGLRSILRQDPDIIMVGEIRDMETAEVSIQASLTGHLVLSTLHTNDAAGAVTRLVDMGIEPFLVSSSILGVLAQRLVRTLCAHCREPYDPSPKTLADLGIERDDLTEGVLYRGVGCTECMNTGYRGRTGIYELLTVDDSVRELVMKGVDASTIRKAAVESGMTPIRTHGGHKAAEGLTSAEEVLRVTNEES